MHVEIVAYLLCSLLYGGLSVYFWRTRWASVEPHALHSPLTPVAEHACVLAPLTLHAALLGFSLFGADGLHLGLGNAVSAIVWLSALIYWGGNFFYPLEGLQALVLPLASIAVLLQGLMPPAPALPNTEPIAFKFHLLIAMLAYSLLTIASLHVLLMALIERRLHDGTLTQRLPKLPPLLTMETLLFRLIWAGFILLTLTLISGVVFSEALFGKPAQFNHKTVFGVISWCIFAALLAGRQIYGWRGRMAVRWTLAGFVALVLAYIGSKFVVEVLLGR
jgi:ABC-type uncharacterized transport system permease subunit